MGIHSDFRRCLLESGGIIEDSARRRISPKLCTIGGTYTRLLASWISVLVRVSLIPFGRMVRLVSAAINRPCASAHEIDESMARGESLFAARSLASVKAGRSLAAYLC